MIRMLAGAVALIVVLLLLVWVFQRRLIYLPYSGAVPPADQVLASAEDVTLHTTDGLALAGWYVRPPRGRPAAGVLVANGNAGNRAFRAPLAHALAERGFAVLLFDYRGYGGNPGTPTEQGLARDVRAAHDYLVQEAGLPAQKLIYFGESLGAAVVAELASEHPPAGLLLRSPFVDLASVGREHYPILPVRAMLWDRYPLARYVADLDLPVTVVYGTEDGIVPPGQSRAVADAARNAEVVAIRGAGHNDPALLDGPGLIQAVVGLARRANLAGAPSGDQADAPSGDR